MNNHVPSYTILTTRGGTAYNEQGRVITTRDVTIRFADGQMMTLQIPLSEYNADTVKQFADDAAERHFAVMGVQGDLMPRPQRAPGNRAGLPASG